MLNQVQSARKANSGQAIMLFALAFVLMAGVLGLVLDGGRIYYERNRVQMAADSGAVAGVQELRRGYNGSSTGFNDRVIDDVELHGINSSNSTITVYNPPSSTSAHAGDALYVEVKVAREVPTTFMRIFGPKYSTVSARAVAGLERAGDPCIIVLDEDDPDAFKTNGTISLVADCGVMVNSNAPSYAARNTGSGCISVTWFGVTGGFDGSCVSPTPKTGLTRVIDPLANLAAPAKPSNAGTMYTFVNSEGQTTKAFTPGYYNNEIKVTNGDVNAYFFPGLYYLEKGMKITGAKVYGVGVMFYNNSTNGNFFIDVSSNERVIFTAPTGGTYRGMLFFSNRNAPYGNPGNKIARGTLDSYFSGAHYFPSQHLDWAGNPDSDIHWAMVISKTLNISGTASVNVRVNKPTKEQAPPSYAAVMFE